MTEKVTRFTSGRLPNGPAAAAILSSAIGVFVIGLLTTLSEANASFGHILNWYNPAGNLTGKTGVGIIVWLICWAILGSQWRERDVEFGKMVTWAFVLIVLGFLLTFPPFFGLFG